MPATRKVAEVFFFVVVGEVIIYRPLRLPICVWRAPQTVPLSAALLRAAGAFPFSRNNGAPVAPELLINVARQLQAA